MSKIQKIIIPRNWLFGRLSYINNNLKSIGRVNAENFTIKELANLRKASALLSSVISCKEENSEILELLHKKV